VGFDRALSGLYYVFKIEWNANIMLCREWSIVNGENALQILRYTHDDKINSISNLKSQISNLKHFQIDQ